MPISVHGGPKLWATTVHVMGTLLQNLFKFQMQQMKEQLEQLYRVKSLTPKIL